MRNDRALVCSSPVQCFSPIFELFCQGKSFGERIFDDFFEESIGKRLSGFGVDRRKISTNEQIVGKNPSPLRIDLFSEEFHRMIVGHNSNIEEVLSMVE